MLGVWRRPLFAAIAAIGIFGGSEIAAAAAAGDIARLAKKYPSVAAGQTAEAAIAGLPIIGGIVGFFANPAISTAEESGMSDEDKKQLELDHAIVTWAPIVGLIGLIIGLPLAFYFLWTDVIRGPTARQAYAESQRLAGEAGVAAAVPLSVVPLPAAQQVAPTVAAVSAPAASAPSVVAASPLPATGNPETFERGTKARAVRDVLAERIEEGGGAKEPFAVATAIVKKKGPERAAEGLPPSDVKAELKEQAAEGHK